LTKIFKYLAVVSIVYLNGCSGNLNETPMSVKTSEDTIKTLVFNDHAELVSYIDTKANPFVKEKRINEFKYSSILKPVDYLIAKKRVDENNPNLKKEDFEDLQYFDLRINIEEFNQEFIKYNLNSAHQYSERVNYCAFKMQNDIKLIDGHDTLNCVLFHHERAFNVVPYGHFILGFEKSNHPEKLKTLVFHDNLFNNGIIKFTFSPKNIILKKSLV